MYVDSVEGMFEHLWIETDDGLGFIAEFKGNVLKISDFSFVKYAININPSFPFLRL